jgi:hypothetical protein
MNRSEKILLAIAILSVVGLLIWAIKSINDVSEKQKIIETSIAEQRQLADNIIRAQSSYIQKDDLEKISKSNNIDLKPINDDLKKIDASIKAINIVKTSSTGSSGSNKPSTGTTPRPDQVPTDPDKDLYNYQNNRQEFLISENFKDQPIPIGSVGFSAWKKNPWDDNIYPRQYKVVNVLAQDDNGRHFVYNKLLITTNGKEYSLKLDESRVDEVLPESKWRFDTRLYAGFDGGLYFSKPSAAFVPNLELFLFSYGRVKADPSLIAIGIGAGYEIVNNEVAFIFSPINYNIGHDLPLVNNVFVGPSLSVDINGNLTALVGLKFGL